MKVIRIAQSPAPSIPVTATVQEAIPRMGPAQGCAVAVLDGNMGKWMVLNIVMVGFFAAITELLRPEALRNAVMDSVPPDYRDLNLRAFD